MNNFIGGKMKNTFKYNKKRKHYAYIFKTMGIYCVNILLTTKAESKHKKHGRVYVIRNVPLFKHPNKSGSNIAVFIYNHSPYFDKHDSFDLKELNWSFDICDKRKIKRFRKYKKYKRYFDSFKQ